MSSNNNNNNSDKQQSSETSKTNETQQSTVQDPNQLDALPQDDEQKLKAQDEASKKNETSEEKKGEAHIDVEDIALVQKYSRGPYSQKISKIEEEIKNLHKKVDGLSKKDSDTGLAPQRLWDLNSDNALMKKESALKVAKCTKIMEDEKYMIRVPQEGKYVVGLHKTLAPTDVEEDSRVGIETGYQSKSEIKLPLPPKLDPAVKMMEIAEVPDITYDDVGGCKEQIEQIRECVEWPLLYPERYSRLGINPPGGVLLYGPPGTGKTLTAKAVANKTDATFIRVIGTELVQRYIGEGARMVRDLFQMARQKKAAIMFFDEIDSIGGTRFGDNGTGGIEVQRTMLEIVNQLDGFSGRGNVKVLMATNRPDTLDPALTRPGRIDRKIEFGMPDLEARVHIFKIHASKLNKEKNIRFELLARLCPNTSGAEIRSVCTEAGMFAIRDRRKIVNEKDMLDSISKVIKGYKRFSSTANYMIFN
uniref:AAA+ ATPase domain-containing protein n=1 Tax=Percolomonas cosmopolitus TaxID=63605 RepID=A0A7S1KM91_9EUKA